MEENKEKNDEFSDSFDEDTEDNEDKKGLTKENLKKLSEPPKKRDWFVFVMIVLVLILAYFYWKDVTALQEVISYCQTNCVCQ